MLKKKLLSESIKTAYINIPLATVESNGLMSMTDKGRFLGFDNNSKQKKQLKIYGFTKPWESIRGEMFISGDSGFKNHFLLNVYLSGDSTMKVTLTEYLGKLETKIDDEKKEFYIEIESYSILDMMIISHDKTIKMEVIDVEEVL